MNSTLDLAQKTSWFSRTGKIVAVAASTGAALMTIFSALFSYGVLGKSESHQSLGNMGAAWVKVRPSVDTAVAVGDTMHFAATIADRSGSVLVGARPTWTTGDAKVAVVLADGSVVARGPGMTSVSVVVGTLVASSRILVRPVVANVVVTGPSGDTAVVALEGRQMRFLVRALDSRGHPVVRAPVKWHADDTSVVAVDTLGIVTGRNAGRTVITAEANGVSGRAMVSVVTVAAKLDVVAGAAQRSLAGAVLPQTVVVRATDRRGLPSSGQTVTFQLRPGQGSVSPRTSLTDADGRARALWTLGDFPGQQTLLATVENVDGAVPIAADADPVLENTRVAVLNDKQAGRTSTELGEQAGIRITDTLGRALAGVPVHWSALDGGTLNVSSDRTDSAGVSNVRWTLSKRTGTQRLTAQVGGVQSERAVPPVTITARAVAGSPAAIVVIGGDGQQGAVGLLLASPLIIRVVDSNGSGVDAATILLSPSGGSLPDTVMRTDSLGLAELRWTLGRSAGMYTVAAHTDGVKKLTKLSARATAAEPANLSFDDVGTENKRGKRAARGKKVYALVTDVYGNPVPDRKVSFAATAGTVTPARAVTDSRGRVALTWLTGTKTGEQSLSGSVRDSDVRGSYVTLVSKPASPGPKKD
ncbi:MAG TPA: Ig-like domain-containing protein [Gemmatimonadaceae bacterium]|nr:Ig-like domain-containing protein [Gemmatimonadaceae bacterium]